MKRTTGKRSPMECRTLDQVCELRTDNHTVGDHWILTDSYNVSVVAQKRGEPSTQSVSIERKTFNKLIRWYMRQQTIRGNR